MPGVGCLQVNVNVVVNCFQYRVNARIPGRPGVGVPGPTPIIWLWQGTPAIPMALCTNYSNFSNLCLIVSLIILSTLTCTSLIAISAI